MGLLLSAFDPAGPSAICYLPAATAKGDPKLVTYSWTKVHPAPDPGRIHFRGIQGLGMGGTACNRLRPAGSWQIMTLKPVLSSRSFAQKRKRKRPFALYRRASIYMRARRSADMFTETQIQIHFAQPRAAVVFRPQSACGDKCSSVVNVQPGTGPQ